MSIKIIHAEGIRDQAEKKANKEASVILAEAKAYAESRMKEAQNKDQILTMLAENRLESSKHRSKALIVESEAEGQQANNLENKRKHSERMKLSEDLQSMVTNNKIIMSGK